MATAKTELEWSYTPADFFEAPYRHETVDYTLFADAGKVLVTLAAPSDPIDAKLQDRIRKAVEDLFRIRQLSVHRPFHLDEIAKVCQHGTDGKKLVLVALEGVLSVVGQADFTIHDASGKLVKDTKSERIAEDTKLIESLAPKVASSATLDALLESYNAAVSDPANELVHLYEIRDALAAHYSGENEALQKLQFTEKDWSQLGYLANKAPLKEGRHRGWHLKLRHAAQPNSTKREILRVA